MSPDEPIRATTRAMDGERLGVPLARTHCRERRCAGGVHVFDRESGLNILFDEVRVPPHQWARAPRYVSIALTNACDLRCPHCYAPKRAARLDSDMVKQWLRELDSNGCLGVGFGGGEPTLYPEFAALCRFAAVETNLAVTFTTHAHRLTDALLGQLGGHVHFVRVSMDGVERTYEEIRGRPFSQLLLRLRSLHGIAPFGINFVVNAQTVSELDAAAKYASDYGATEFLLLPELVTPTRPGMDVATRARLSAWIKYYRGSIPLVLSESAAQSLPLCTPIPGESGLRAYAHVDASSVLKATSLDADGVRIGDDGFIAALDRLQRRASHDTI